MTDEIGQSTLQKLREAFVFIAIKVMIMCCFCFGEKIFKATPAKPKQEGFFFRAHQFLYIIVHWPGLKPNWFPAGAAECHASVKCTSILVDLNITRIFPQPGNAVTDKNVEF